MRRCLGVFGARTAANDNDPNWVDEPMNNEEQECLWRHDEVMANEQLPDLTSTELAHVDAHVDYKGQRIAARHQESITFRYWQLYWAKICTRVQKKLRRPIPDGKILRNTFSGNEQQVWRLMAAWEDPTATQAEKDEGAWHELPGWPEDWPEDFDYARYG